VLGLLSSATVEAGRRLPGLQELRLACRDKISNMNAFVIAARILISCMLIGLHVFGVAGYPADPTVLSWHCLQVHLSSHCCAHGKLTRCFVCCKDNLSVAVRQWQCLLALPAVQIMDTVDTLCCSAAGQQCCWAWCLQCHFSGHVEQECKLLVVYGCRLSCVALYPACPSIAATTSATSAPATQCYKPVHSACSHHGCTTVMLYMRPFEHIRGSNPKSCKSKVKTKAALRATDS
jgi:hypothetical protein